jgi:hypothetical protein
MDAEFLEPSVAGSGEGNYGFFLPCMGRGAGWIWRFFLFTKAVMAGTPIFNHGKMKRDLTYVDD